MRGAPLLQEDSGLQQNLTQVIWNNAESPVSLGGDGVKNVGTCLVGPNVASLECLPCDVHFDVNVASLYYKVNAFFPHTHL